MCGVMLGVAGESYVDPYEHFEQSHGISGIMMPMKVVGKMGKNHLPAFQYHGLFMEYSVKS
jgi:hypothetical protein